jgi:hypothetical protein
MPSSSKADDSLSKADSVPWIGTYVIIMKFGNHLKGYVGIVKDVLCAQDTASGLKMAIQLVHLDSSTSFKTIVVDYDDVVEQKIIFTRFNIYFVYFKDWIFTFRLCTTPKCSLPTFKDLYEVCTPDFWTSTTGTDAWEINFQRNHPNA